MSESPPLSNQAVNYRVLARKYRPNSFDALIGQQAMVRTLGNAIATGRIAHAFLLTGVRGVGKTSTARLIAKALNCIGPEGTGGPTMAPCGVCEHCQAISESRHIDVIEMDAASRTGVDDVREIIEAVRYASVSARYKIYIIDEVHMLSKNAFNALLKTLEEPPPHVKFIFATTEVRKLPITVLSRCQRFDLRRISLEALKNHFLHIARLEAVDIEEQAALLIAKAAEGSVRDGLSILDQAIAHGHGAVHAQAVADMLGLADRTHVLALLDDVLNARVEPALDKIRQAYDVGADPGMIVADLLSLTHQLTRAQALGMPEVDLSESERRQITEWLPLLSAGALHRFWSLLLHGLQEVQTAPDPLAASEMLLLRLIYAGDLPDPADLIDQLSLAANSKTVSGRTAPPAPQKAGSTLQSHAPIPPAAHQALAPSTPTPPLSAPPTLDGLLNLLTSKREGLMAKTLMDDVVIIHYAPGEITLAPRKTLERDFAVKLRHLLEQLTDQRWQIILKTDIGTHSQGATLYEKQQAQEAEERAAIIAHPFVQAIFNTFPGAKLEHVEPALGQELETNRRHS
jgi:DNA polymerase-3 subunit gamma/tau